MHFHPGFQRCSLKIPAHIGWICWDLLRKVFYRPTRRYIRLFTAIMAHLSSSDAPDLWKTYTKEREVGRGRYAKVYKANEVETKRILAVKVFDKLPSRSEDDHRRAAIRREVKLLNKVRDGVSTKAEEFDMAANNTAASYHSCRRCTIYEQCSAKC